METKYDLVLKNGSVLSDSGPLSRFNIGIIDGEIVCITSNELDGSKVIDCSNKVITPSFANAHCHLAMNIFKGISEDVDINTWFNRDIWPYEKNLTPEMVYQSAKLGMVELVNNGITVVADHYFFPEAVLQAAMDSGIKIAMAPTIFGEDRLDEAINATLDLNRKYSAASNIEIMFGPHSPYLCNPDTLRKIAIAAKSNNLKTHIHVGETKEQVNEHVERYGVSPLSTLKSSGILDNKCILAHNLALGEGDENLLNVNHHVALCPKTYQKLGMKIDSLDRIVNFNWVLGTDGSGSSNSLSIVEQARLFSLISKQTLGPTTMELNFMWDKIMKTHEVFSFKTGAIVKGYRADIIVWDLDKPNTYPVNNVLASILYSSDSQNIEYVISDGIILKERFSVKQFGEPLLSDFKVQQELLFGKGKGNAVIKY